MVLYTITINYRRYYKNNMLICTTEVGNKVVIRTCPTKVNFGRIFLKMCLDLMLLPTRASEQGNVIGLVSVCVVVYVVVIKKKL